MNIHEACAAILGKDIARSVIEGMGIHWCVVAAMAEASTDDNPAALAAIRAWNAEQKAKR